MSEANLIHQPGLPAGNPDVKFPGLRWDPKTGNCETFNSAGDVPEGWLDHHPDDPAHGGSPRAAKADKPAAADKVELPLTRKEIMEHLKAGNVTFSPTLGTAALYELLVTSAKEALTAAAIEFDPAETNAVTLLGLFTKE